jgi:hypothetical protein
MTHCIAMGGAAMGKIPSLDMSRAVRVVMMRPHMRENLGLCAGCDEEGQGDDHAQKSFHSWLHYGFGTASRFCVNLTKNPATSRRICNRILPRRAHETTADKDRRPGK